MTLQQFNILVLAISITAVAIAVILVGRGLVTCRREIAVLRRAVMSLAYKATGVAEAEQEKQR